MHDPGGSEFGNSFLSDEIFPSNETVEEISSSPTRCPLAGFSEIETTASPTNGEGKIAF
ncbi:hypothetical protein [Natrialbaceae archaeon AArc-T1-2]|uniref:hypothetical protein n=1 Tax=Natrialbaceae archaeon AArc-T1-2 TaxID=3053904 RepID=UPI00255A9A4C|nr:hypothetical protein [Natrialbaceae archaeon AArc-T1-2]WIV67966.1 hypothetical protein QQ977_04335 [Natrialbaceae archaeon AArc-T1-2]